MAKKNNNDLLMYAAIGVGAYLLLSKKSTTAVLPVTTALPGSSAALQLPPANTTASAAASLVSSLTNIFKTVNPAPATTAPVTSSGGSLNIDGSSLLDTTPLPGGNLTNYATPYDPFATGNAAPTNLTGFDTTCTDCFESVDDSISGIGVAATPLTLNPVNTSATVSNIVQALVSNPTPAQITKSIPVAPTVMATSAVAKPAANASGFVPSTAGTLYVATPGHPLTLAQKTHNENVIKNRQAANVAERAKLQAARAKNATTAKPVAKAASAINKSLKFTMPYGTNSYKCCCNKGALIAGMVMESM